MSSASGNDGQKVTLGAKVPQHLADQIETLADLLDISKSELIRRVLEDEIESYEQEIEEFMENQEEIRSQLQAKCDLEDFGS